MKSRLSLALTLLLFSAVQLTAQNLPQIRTSPHAKVLQQIGLSEITIDYHRPAVLGREIWNKIVPFGMTNPGFGTAKEAPWRAGANENTTITFSDDVKINGKQLPAGTYGLHMIVTDKDWTVIFNKVSTAWGSFFYNPAEDALRVTVTPEKSDFTEWLVYGFENLTTSSGDVFLKWENLKVKFNAEFDTDNVVLDRYKKVLVGAQGFNAQTYQQAAAYFIGKNKNLDQASEWIDHSIKIQENAPNLLTKAQFLQLRGNREEAESLTKKAINIASETELNTYGYNLLLQQKNIDKSIEVFKINVEKHPDSWNVFDSLAEAFAAKGDKKNAQKYYKMALEKSPESQKERIKNAIAGLE